MFAKEIRLAQELKQTARQKGQVTNLLKLTPLPEVGHDYIGHDYVGHGHIGHGYKAIAM